MTVPDVLLPGDDRTVVIQLAVAVGVGGMALILARRNRDLFLLIAGLVVLLLGVIGVRAVH